MATPNEETDSGFARFASGVRRAFGEFLLLPALTLAAFVALAGVTSFLDGTDAGWVRAFREPLRQHLFRDPQATSSLFATAATGVITVTSITFSLLLLAVQQSAAALSHQVYDQFLRRRINQFYFGFFVGLAVFSLVILGTVDRPYNPVCGATAALALTGFGLAMLVVLLYTTVNQMRPAVAIAAIHDLTLSARAGQAGLLAATRPPRAAAGEGVTSRRDGYVVAVDHESLAAAARRAGGTVGCACRSGRSSLTATCSPRSVRGSRPKRCGARSAWSGSATWTATRATAWNSSR